MVHLTVLRDNREKRGWDFDEFDVKIRDVTIETGDYTIEEFCDYNNEIETYLPRFAVERKGGQDFVSSITRDRERFKDEIKRASDWDSELLVLIEEPKLTFKRKRDFMQYRDVSPNSIFGTVEKWEQYYNVSFEFVGTRERAQCRAFEALSDRLRSILTS